MATFLLGLAILVAGAIAGVAYVIAILWYGKKRAVAKNK